MEPGLTIRADQPLHVATHGPEDRSHRGVIQQHLFHSPGHRAGPLQGGALRQPHGHLERALVHRR